MDKLRIIQITEKLDERKVCELLGIKPRSIRLARERGMFPASWYKPLTEHCSENGVDCPDDLFNWKSPSVDAQHGANS